MTPYTQVQVDAGLDTHYTLVQGKWALWKWIAVRGAGFPVEAPLKLSMPNSTAKIDGILDREEAEEKHRRQILEQVSEALDELRREFQWHDRQRRAPLLKALKSLSQGKTPARESPLAGIDELLAMEEELHRKRKELAEIFQREQDQVANALREEISQDAFREAVIWQNRHVYHTALLPLIERIPLGRRDSKQRQQEEVAASYLQRYSLKNETIGYFGPVAWAQLRRQGEIIKMHPGDSLVRRRNLYFEVWGIDQLAKTLDLIEGVKWWIPPRAVPFIRLEGQTLHIPGRHPLLLSPEQAAILTCCNGENQPTEILRRLQAQFSAEQFDMQFLCDGLALLDQMGVIVWRLEVPLELRPDRALMKLIARINDARLQAQVSEPLAELARLEREIEHARGNPDRLDQALERLDDCFRQWTGKMPTRNHGEAYAARTLVYEDCTRDLSIEFGPEILTAISPALSLLLSGARWLVAKTAVKYRKIFRASLEQITRKEGVRTVDFVHFWESIFPLVTDVKNSPLETISHEFQRRWAAIFGKPEGRSQLWYSSEQLGAAVRAAFETGKRGWKKACYHSPDLMIMASGEEAIRQNRFTCIMGEMHVGLNTLAQSLFTSQHPRPDELFSAVDRDYPDPVPYIVISKENNYLSSARLTTALVRAKDIRIRFTPDPVEASPELLLHPSDLVVEAEGESVQVRTRDGRWRFDLLDMLFEFLSIHLADLFRIRLGANHTPRITIDRLIIARESWRFTPLEIEFASEMDPVNRFIAARRWARAHKIPRFVFAKSPGETKPFYVDFESPLYLDLFSKSVRRALDAGSAHELFSLSEMLPAHQDAWLSDAAGRRYTSELRIVVVDLED